MSRGLTVAQVATVCGVSPATVRKWVQRGRLARNGWGRIELAELTRYLDERGTVGQHKRARRFGIR